ncbi:hypothetical protein E4U59_000473, partial [Claviceps monticola]
MIQQGYQTSGETESEASFQSPISKGKQPANSLDKGKRTEALSNDQLDPNHPKNIGQQFDASGNSVHTGKASSRTRAHGYYQTGQHNNIATAGPSNRIVVLCWMSWRFSKGPLRLFHMLLGAFDTQSLIQCRELAQQFFFV